MNFFRRKLARNDLMADTVDPDTHRIYSSTLEKECLGGEKLRRQSYFSLRRREAPSIVATTAPAPATKIVTLASGEESDRPEKNVLRRRLSRKLNGDSDSGAKALRRRSIPVISYLISKRSESKLGGTGNAAPTKASSHEGKAMQHEEKEEKQRINACRTSESSSGDESSGGESDDTLATQDCSHDALVEFRADPTNGDSRIAAAEGQPDAAITLFPSSGMPAAGNGSSAGSLDHAQSCINGEGIDNAPSHRAALIVRKEAETSTTTTTTTTTTTALSKPAQHRRRSLLLRIGLPTTSSGATATADAGSGNSPPQRRQLALVRVGAGKEEQEAGRKTQWHTQLVQRKVASAVCSTLAGIHGSAEHSKEHRLLGSPVLKMPGAGDGGPKHRLRIKAHDRAEQTAGKKRSGNGLGRLFHPPPLTETEQKRMDAWAADDDDFSTDEYDLTGVYFELPAINMLAAEPTPIAHKSNEGTKGSRLSSTSTVVDDGALSPELSKRLFIASARKLQLSSSGRHGMVTLLHIRNAMVRANEQYVVASGGRRLAGPSTASVMVAELYARDDRYYERAMLARAYSSSCRSLGGPDAPALVPDRDLLGFGSGDLVSLDPTIASHGSSASRGRYRRRRTSRRWRVPQSCSSTNGCVAAAIPAGGMP